ncbi:MAG: MarR family transcriptional regulator [Beijerinckiaceae bacterium]|nr:MarR family transcriptional regulator [Beijerinckiaceae bacterium]
MSARKPDPRTGDIMLRHWREAVPNDRIAHLIKDSSRGLQRALQMRLARHNVSFGHWVFLRILWVRDGITQRELSEEAGLMEPTTFSALTSMEKLGYLERRKLPHSRKNVYVFLTPAGRQLKKKLVPLAEDVNEIAVQGIDPADVATTRRTLLVMIENIARDESEHADPTRAARMRRMLDVIDNEPTEDTDTKKSTDAFGV